MWYETRQPRLRNTARRADTAAPLSAPLSERIHDNPHEAVWKRWEQSNETKIATTCYRAAEEVAIRSILLSLLALN